MRGHDHGAAARARRGEPPHARLPEPRGAGAGPRSAACGAATSPMGCQCLPKGAAAGAQPVGEKAGRCGRRTCRALTCSEVSLEEVAKG